jgi:hypothetical protein
MVDKNKKLEGLNASLTKAEDKLKAAKTEKEKADAQKAVDAIKKSIDELQNTSDNKGTKANDKAKRELAMMDKYKVNELFINTDGQYFTSKNLAENSVKDKKAIKTITRENVESKAK